MFESIGVLIIFFFLIVLGLSFYFLVAKTGAKQEFEKGLQLKGIEVVRKAVTLPELDCARVGVQVENCFDKLKLSQLALLINSDRDVYAQYSPLFGPTEITVTEIFPDAGQTVVLFDNPIEDAGFDLSLVPILLFDPIEDRFDFALMEIKYYEREVNV